MTVTGQTPRPLPSDGDPAARQSRRRDATAVHEVCPYLAVEDGSWRSAYAAREHRCQAVTPPAPLTVDKQRQLCLQPAHASCATFIAARAVAAESNPAGPGDDGASLWPASGSAPVVLEPARRMGALPTASARSGGQALLVGLMVLAFIVLVIARTQSPAGGSDPSQVPGGAVAGVASASPTTPPAATPSSQGSPTPDPSAESTVPPSATPGATPKPSPTAAHRRYKVKPGDTMSSIASRYGTTVKKLAALNKIADPRVLKVGQVLLIP